MQFTSTILCVDDDVDDLLFLQEAIRSQGRTFEIMQLKDGEEALEFLQQAKSSGQFPCLIIMDINMPKMDGKKAVELIKLDETLSKIPLIIFTTSSSITDKRFFELYQVQYITKPHNYASFSGKVAEMLAYCGI
ncbi:MAG TPA: response regulator [Flavisolibacter sp.]